MSNLKTTANRTWVRLAALLACVFSMSGCDGNPIQQPDILTKSATTSNVLRLATTTSTRDSGLLDELLPVFEKARNCRVDVVAVGTGAALKLGEAGDVDVLLVHDRESEEAFMEAGHGIRHEEFMYNQFTILGPADDPARIQDAQAIDALKKIVDGKHRFVSRGDDSGTHKRELALWENAGGRPSWENYLESGQGMGPTLVMADEMRAYILTDMGTYLSFKNKIVLVPLTAVSDQLRNPYAAIVIDPEKHERINQRLANALVDFLISADAQQLIKDYRIAGQQLFHPTRLDASE